MGVTSQNCDPFKGDELGDAGDKLWDKMPNGELYIHGDDGGMMNVQAMARARMEELMEQYETLLSEEDYKRHPSDILLHRESGTVRGCHNCGVGCAPSMGWCEQWKARDVG